MICCICNMHTKSDLMFTENVASSLCEHMQDEATDELGQCKSAFQDMFSGQLQTTVTCSCCGHKSHTQSDLMDLSLELPKKPRLSLQV